MPNGVINNRIHDLINIWIYQDLYLINNNDEHATDPYKKYIYWCASVLSDEYTCSARFLDLVFSGMRKETRFDNNGLFR